MKRMIFHALLCAVLVVLSFVAYENHQDFLFGVLLALAVIPSCLFNEARKEWRGE